MLIVLNEHTGMSADKPRKEIIASSASELDDIEVGHGSIAYVIEDSALYAYDEDNEEWVEIQTGGGGGGGSDLPEVTASDNGKVLSVVDGAWDAASPATELPAVTSSDGGKVLTVVNGKWQKASPVLMGMRISRICVQDWGNEYVLCNPYPDSGTYFNSNFDNVDAIYIDNTDDSVSVLGTFASRMYYHSGQESRNSNAVKFENPNSTQGIVVDALSGAEHIKIEGVTFTWSSADGYWLKSKTGAAN